MIKRPTGKNVSFAELYESMDHLKEGSSTVYVSKNKQVVVKKIGDKFDVENLVGDTLAGPFGNIKAAEKAAEKAASKLKESLVELGVLIESATDNAAKSLQAILGMFKGKTDNDIYKMGKGIQDHYKKEGSFSPDQAKWIWKTSVALFKK